MRLKNYTNISDERIRQMIQFVRPSGISRFDVRISNCAGDGYRGVAYHQGSGYHSTADPLIVVSVTRNEKAFPYYEMDKKPGYIPTLLLSREEATVHVIAHELRHLWQAKHKGYRVWGARGKFSERDADAYAIRKVREWRRKNR